MTQTPKEKDKQYFTKVHEEAILEYASIIDYNRKNFLYREFIQPVFNEMVDKIVFTYKFNTLPNIDQLRDECKIWLTTILDKYDTTNGSKAFSYYSVITKNWFIQNVKKTNKERKRKTKKGSRKRKTNKKKGSRKRKTKTKKGRRK